MPSDWYVGFDQFTTYSFLGLINQDLFKMDSYLGRLAPVDDDSGFFVDFGKDFDHLSKSGTWLGMIQNRFSNVMCASWHLTICVVVVYAIDLQLKAALKQVVSVPDKR